MAAIASRSHVVQIESQVRPLLNRNLMIGMQMTFAIRKVPSKLFQHFLCWDVAEFEPPEIGDYLWLPAAIHALPPITLEAQNPQPAVVRIVSAVTA
jgi:hypothetical protein